MGDLDRTNETKTSGTMAFMIMQILMSFSFFSLKEATSKPMIKLTCPAATGPAPPLDELDTKKKP
jgi:hypothetical protein